VGRWRCWITTRGVRLASEIGRGTGAGALPFRGASGTSPTHQRPVPDRVVRRSDAIGANDATALYVYEDEADSGELFGRVEPSDPGSRSGSGGACYRSILAACLPLLEAAQRICSRPHRWRPGHGRHVNCRFRFRPRFPAVAGCGGGGRQLLVADTGRPPRLLHRHLPCAASVRLFARMCGMCCGSSCVGAVGVKCSRRVGCARVPHPGRGRRIVTSDRDVGS